MTSVYIRKGGAGCASSQSRGLIVKCTQGQVLEAQLESLLILASIVIPAPDVKRTNRDPREAHLGVESTCNIDNCYSSIDTTKGCDLTKESAPPNHVYGVTQMTPVGNTQSGPAFRSCTSEDLAARRSSGPVPFSSIGFSLLSIHSALRSLFVGARSSALCGCRSDTTWWKGYK